MSNTISHTMHNSNIIDIRIFNEVELMISILFSMNDIDTNNKRKMKILLIDTNNFDECMTDEFIFQPWDMLMIIAIIMIIIGIYICLVMHHLVVIIIQILQ